MKNKNLRNSFKYAGSGIFSVLKAERNMKIHFTIMILVIILGFIFKINKMEWFICILLFGLVLSAECMNTAIEKTVDICSPEKNELARIAKDASAGAVLILAIVSATIGFMIFIPKIL